MTNTTDAHSHFGNFHPRLHRFFKDAAIIKAIGELGYRFYKLLYEWTGTSVGAYITVPGEVKTEVVQRIQEHYEHEYCAIEQNPYGDTEPLSPLFAFVTALQDLDKEVEAIIIRNQNIILHEIAEMALTTCPDYNNDDDEY